MELRLNSHARLPITDLLLLGALTLSSATRVRLEVRGAVPRPINPVHKTCLFAFATGRDPTRGCPSHAFLLWPLLLKGKREKNGHSEKLLNKQDRSDPKDANHLTSSQSPA